jgi:probable HAF family extracellular repeat protein
MRQLRALLAAVLCLGIAGPSAAAPPVPFDLGVLPGDESSYSNAISGNGHVVGTSYNSSARRAFVWTAASGMIDLGDPVGAWSDTADVVSDSGQVVGVLVFPSNGVVHAFSWTASGGMVDLGTLGGSYSFASAVNSSGQVVGQSLTGDGAYRAFSWTAAGGMVDLGTLGGSYSYPYAVNSSGQVVGISPVAGDNAIHAFLWTSAGGMVDLGTLGGTSSEAYAINSSGHVVGQSTIPGDTFWRAFLWTPTDGMMDLGVLDGFDTSYAWRLNDSGQIVGGSYGGNSSTYREHATLWQSSRYTFTGFFAPIDNNDVMNTMKAGASVPVKFSLNGDKGLNILAAGAPTSKAIPCPTAIADNIEQTVTAGGSSLTYDPRTDTYIYVWETDKTWAGTCRELNVQLDDNSQHKALFKFTK